MDVDHPPGQPLASLVIGAVQRIPLGSLSFRAAIASALCAAIAAGALFLALETTVRAVGARTGWVAYPLAIAGTEGLLVSYARCCFPIPDDAIFAFLSAGRGVVVHRENCVNVEDYRKHPENWLPVAWQATSDKLFSSEIRVDVANKMGVLAAVAAAISSGDTNIERVAVEEKDADSSSLVFELRVRNREHLARVVKVIRRMPEVLKVTRTIASHGRSSRSAD